MATMRATLKILLSLGLSSNVFWATKFCMPTSGTVP